MTIEIHQPQLEAIILERMQSGRFANVEDLLIDAFRSNEVSTPSHDDRRTIRQVFAAARGLAEDLVITRDRSTARAVDLS